MDTTKLVELLRAIFENPFYDSYLRPGVPDAAPEEARELSPEAKALIAALSASPVEPVAPAFKRAFLAVVILTAASGLGAIAIAFEAGDPLQPNQQAIFETLNTAWKMGFGAIVGLLGGKAT